MLQRLAAEPLAQFLLIGAGLFLLHAAVRSREPVGEIRVSRGQLFSLAALHERAWMRPPTRRELQGLMDSWIREEVAEREGVPAYALKKISFNHCGTFLNDQLGELFFVKHFVVPIFTKYISN
jgi:hypothetical protein